jgi:hypothetical protein
MSGFKSSGRAPVESRATATSVWAFVGLAAIAACGPDHTPTASHPSALAVCPATPDETIGAACGVAGLRCGPQYTCGVLSVSLSCICTGGAFQCTDGAGNPLVPGAPLDCPATQPTASCPATETGAQFASCTEVGLLCAYPSACPGRLDSCQCLSGQIAGGSGFRFECTRATCSPNDGGAIAIDSGAAMDTGLGTDSQTARDSSGDSRSDAPGDGPVESDTSTGDGRPD